MLSYAMTLSSSCDIVLIQFLQKMDILMGLDKSRSHDLCHFEQPFNLTSISVLRIAQSHNAPISLIYVVIVHNLFDLIE